MSKYQPQEPQSLKQLRETPLDRVQADYPDLFTPKDWTELKEAYGENLPDWLPLENPEKYL